MRLKTPFYVVLFLIVPLMSIGQECGTLSPANYQTYERTKQERGFDRTNIDLHPEICLNVYYNIVRYSNGTGGIAESKLIEMTALLNQEYNPHNLFFNQLGFDYIDNTDYYTLSDSEYSSLVQINNQGDAINIYIVGGAGYHGEANGIGSQALVIVKDYVLQSTLPHEIGHCLNLLHTFQGTADNTSGCAELIGEIYPNCRDCGDKVCDTPADDGNQNDNGYQPDLTNIMSYYDNRDHFTIGQELRMRDAIEALSVLQNVVGNSCGIVEGDTVTCSDPTTILTLSNAVPPYLWEVIEGSMEIIGSNTGSSVTVAALSSSDSEQGSIEDRKSVV